MKVTKETFLKKFNEIEKVIPYDHSWANGTGYFNYASKLVELKPGEEAKSVATAPDSRRIIFIGTPVGTVVFFERYTDGTGSAFVVVVNRPKELTDLLPEGSQDQEAFIRAAGVYGPNIGNALATVIEKATAA